MALMYVGICSSVGFLGEFLHKEFVSACQRLLESVLRQVQILSSWKGFFAIFAGRLSMLLAL